MNQSGRKIMEQNYGLSDAESLIMNMIWESEKPLLFSEIMNYTTEKEGKTWKKQTVHTYLTRLIKKGVLMNTGGGGRNIYQPTMSKEDFISNWTSDFLDRTFDGSLSSFMLALTGSKKRLKQKDIDELKQFLKDNEQIQE